MRGPLSIPPEMASRYSDSLKQSSLCGNVHWTFPVAVELARSEHPEPVSYIA